MDIVKHVADTDGGAHVDTDIDEAYASLKSGDFLGFRAVFGPDGFGIGLGEGSAGAVVPGAHLAAIRAIANETLLTLKHYSFESFQGGCAPPQ